MTIASAFIDACVEELRAPKPGNVHIHADGHRMTVADFIRSAEVSAPLLCRAGAPLGRRILDAAAATRAAVGQNTNLGILLLCGPLAMAAERCCPCPPWPGLSAPTRPGSGGGLPGRADGAGIVIPDLARDGLLPLNMMLGEGLSGEGVDGGPGSAMTGVGDLDLAKVLRDVIAASTLDDAEAVFAAIRIAAPAGLGSAPRHDVHRPAAVTLALAMAEAADRDSIARQWSNGFADILGIGLEAYESAVDRRVDAALAVYLTFLSAFPDSHVLRRHGASAAAGVQRRAARVLVELGRSAEPLEMLPELLAWDAALKAEGINPGTSADLTVATAFAWRLGLRSGMPDV